MKRVGWLLAAAGALAGAAVAAFVVAAEPRTQAADDARTFLGRAMTLETRVTPRLHAFGDPVVAEVVAAFDRALVRPDSVRARVRFDPYEQISAEERTREDEGSLTRIRFRWRLQCLSRECLPGESKRAIEWEQAAVGYALLDPTLAGSQGARTAGSVAWPTLEIVSRLDRAATQDVRWRAETRTLPEPEYRVDATLATFGLLGAAGSLVGLATFLLAPFAPRRGRDPAEQPVDEAPPLERALLLLETSTNGDVSDRRRTLELVARELDAHGETDLATRARRLAWSKEPPSPQDASLLAQSARGATAAGEGAE